MIVILRAIVANAVAAVAKFSGWLLQACVSPIPAGVSRPVGVKRVAVAAFQCRIFAAILALFFPSALAYGDVITFENLPDAYFFANGGQNIGDFYAGVTFGPNVTGLSVTRFGGYAGDAFPPHSGDVVIWDAVDPTITISFETPVSFFGVWYTSFDPLALDAFDASNNLLGSVLGGPNTDGTAGTTSFLLIADPGIASVNLTSSPGLFTLDDVTTVPEPGSFAFIASALVALILVRRFRRGAVRAGPVARAGLGSLRRCGEWKSTDARPTTGCFRACVRWGSPLLLFLVMASISTAQPPAQQYVFSFNEIVNQVRGVTTKNAGLTVINPATGSYAAVPGMQFICFRGTHPLAISPDYHYVYAVGYPVDPNDAFHNCSSNQNLWILNYSGGSVIDSINLPVSSGGNSDISDLAISPGGRFIYISYQSGHLKELDPTTKLVTRDINLNGTTLGIAVSPDGNFIYAINYPQNSLLVVDALTFSVIKTISLNGTPNSVGVTPDGSRIYVVTQPAYGIQNPGFVQAIDAVSSSVIATISVPCELDFTNGGTSTACFYAPYGIAFSPDGARLYVGKGDDHFVAPTATEIDVATNTISAHISMPWDPQGASASPSGDRVYFATSRPPSFFGLADSELSVVNSTSRSLLYTIPGVGGAVAARPSVPIGSPPSISSQPANQTITSGQGASLSVTAAGTGPLQYQWYQGNTKITVATQSQYSTGPLTTGTYTYTVTITSPLGSVTSQTATVTVQPACVPPQLVTPPANATVTSGNPATVSVTATGSGLTYQWYRNGVLIPGATASTYTTGILTIGDSGMTLSVTVTGQCGAPVTSAATITVIPACTPITFVVSPLSQTVALGSSATLSVLVNGSAPQYQWYLSGGVPVPGAASATYTTPPITALTLYYITVSNSCSSVSSPFAELDLNISLGPASPINPIVFTKDPVNTATGGYYSTHTDMQVKGRGVSFVLAQSYNSGDGYNGPLGFGWTHSYNVFLTVHPQSLVVAIKQGDGSQIYFAPTGSGSYTPVNSGLHDRLIKNADSSFTLTRKNQLQFTFSAQGKLAKVCDRNGNCQLLTYDASGNLAQITDTVGRVFIFGSDSSGRIISVSDPIGRVIRYSYDSSGNLSAFQDAAGGLTQYTYDANHHLISGVDARGITYVQNTYDGQGRVAAQRDGNLRTTTFSYNTPSTGVTTVTDPQGHSTKYVYDANLRIVQIINAQGGTTSFVYDASNNRTSITNANGKTTQFAYDDNGNVMAVTNPLGNAVSFTYNPLNEIVTIVNAGGATTSFAYDASGNLTSILDAAGSTTVLAYDGFGELTIRTDAIGSKTSLRYDAQGNISAMTDGGGNSTSFSYDGLGRAISITDGNGHTFTMSYDALGRRTQAADALGNQTQFKYDAASNLVKLIDANGHSTGYQYDNVNNLVGVVDASGQNASYGYDDNNNRVSFTDANGHITIYAYDSLNRRTKATDPMGLFSLYSYDAIGNTVSATDANGKTHTFSYDALNRVTKRVYADGNVISYVFDVNGIRTSMVDAHGISGYTYDLLNRVTSVSDANGNVVKYGYDKAGHRTSLTYANGRIVHYDYDNAGRLSKVTDWQGRATSYTYDAAGNRISVALPNGAISTYSHDNANRLVSVVNMFGGRVLTSYTYSMDRGGNRVQMLDASAGITRYGYDMLDRLVSWTPPSGQTTTYAYDAVGNRTSVISGSVTTSYAYDADNRLLTAGTSSFTYDPNGNRLTKTSGNTTVAYAFDSMNRLVAVSGGGAATQYQYDGDGNRVAQQAGPNTYKYVMDVVGTLASVLNESGPDGNIDYQYGLSKISGSSASLEQFYQTDGLGSTADVTDTAGSLKASYTYDPWGKLLNPIDPLGTKDKSKFTGEALDPQTGLYYLRARYYDPSVGQFISKDPLSGFASSPASTNRYAYGLNNPMQYTDRSGMSAEPAGSDGFVWRPAVFAPIDWRSSYSLQVSVGTYAGGPASIEPGTLDIGGLLGYGALVGLAAINPEFADWAQPVIEDALDVGSPPSVPSTVGGALANIGTGFKDLLWDTLISPIVTPIQSGISDLYTNLVTYASPPQGTVYLQRPPQQSSDFDVFDLSNYQ